MCRSSKAIDKTATEMAVWRRWAAPDPRAGMEIELGRGESSDVRDGDRLLSCITLNSFASSGLHDALPQVDRAAQSDDRICARRSESDCMGEKALRSGYTLLQDPPSPPRPKWGHKIWGSLLSKRELEIRDTSCLRPSTATGQIGAKRRV